MNAGNMTPFDQAMACKSKQLLTKINRPVEKNNRRKPKSKFKIEEDILLQQIVMQYGTDNWDLVSSMMPGRTPRMCHDRWENYVNPAINHSPWTEAEDHILMQKYAEFGPRWVTLAKYFNGRTDVAVKNRWHILHRRVVSLGTYVLPPRPNHQPKSVNQKLGKRKSESEKQRVNAGKCSGDLFGNFMDFIDDFSFDGDSIFQPV